MIKLVTLFYILCSLSSLALAQSAVDEISGDQEISSSADTSIERIIQISPSGRIIILSNANQSFAQGDFISLAIGTKIFARALCAKSTKSNTAGIKIVQIHSSDIFKTLTPNTQVIVIRGDDSFFRKKSEKKSDDIDSSLIQDEDDLYNDTTMLDDDLTISDAKNRLIKNDNLVAFSTGYIEGLDNEGNAQKYIHYYGSWARQVSANIWAEGSFGINYISDYPTTGLTTQMSNLTVKAKFTYKAPFFTILQPYAGFQIITASNSDAGVDDGSGDYTDEELAAEITAVEALEKNQLVFGLTVLKRLVPGWFIKFDLGSDILSAGLSLEF